MRVGRSRRQIERTGTQRRQADARAGACRLPDKTLPAFKAASIS
jgi:hypothetical protein